MCVPEVIPTDKEEVAFKDLDAAILVGSMPRRDGMERKDLLKANVAIFKSQGKALDKYAKKTVKASNRYFVLYSWLEYVILGEEVLANVMFYCEELLSFFEKCESSLLILM